MWVNLERVMVRACSAHGKKDKHWKNGLNTEKQILIKHIEWKVIVSTKYKVSFNAEPITADGAMPLATLQPRCCERLCRVYEAVLRSDRHPSYAAANTIRRRALLLLLRI
jgi:hypothetical protein